MGARFWLAKCEQAWFGVEGTPLGWGMLGLRYWDGMALVCNPLVPGLCLIYAPHLFTIVPSHQLQLIPSSPIVVHLTPLALGLCLLTSCAFSCCLFTLIRLHMPLVYPFALVCTCCCHSCHVYSCTSRALALALGLCVPALRTYFLFVAAYL